jgi:uncharacterized protein with HEPN domain
MDNKSRDISIIEHIVEHCGRIFTAKEMFGDDYSVFLSNSVYFDAVSMNLLQIGELANHLSKEFKEKHSGIPWRSMIVLRNIVAHGYEILKKDRVWSTVCEDVPILHKQCSEILKK